jgi:hypothetical protein
MIKKFSSPRMRNRQFVFAPKIEYQLAAERSEANQNSLTFPFWCVYLTKSEPFLKRILDARAGPIAKPSACYGASKKQEFLFTP